MKTARQVISREREEQICALADYLGEKYRTESGTDLNRILKDNGIKLRYGDFDEPFDGLLEACEKGFFIFCNQKTGNTPSSVRSRFTIAHELGHYFLDEHRNALIAKMMPSMGEQASKDLVIEREADMFASHLLLPEVLFEKQLKRIEIGLKGIATLANKFSVSVKCAAIRYVCSDPVSSSLAFWSWDGDLVWKWFSQSMWNAGVRKMKPNPISGGAIDQCLKNHGTPGHHSSSTATVNYLFQVSDRAHYHEVILEEAMILGEYGVISLFSAQNGKLESMASILDKRLDR